MSERPTALLIGVTLAAASFGCGGSEKRVVDQYFNALRANDTQTLTSFAMVAFDKKVDDWKVSGTSPETRTPVVLPELAKKVADLEAELAANKKEAGAYSLDHYADIDRVRELRKADRPIPRSLADVAEAWDKFNEKDRELKRALAEAKDAVKHETSNVRLSVGPEHEGIEQMGGEIVSKQVNIDLTIGGEVKPYVMTLRKYELSGDSDRRMISRWVVQSLEPRG